MSLLGRPKAKTHKGMEMRALMKMAGEVEELAEDEQVTAAAIEEQAVDLGVPASKLYAGLGMTPALSLVLEHEVQFVVCTGGCQDYGALPCVEKLVELRQDRLDEEQKAFDVVPRACLNRCQDAPVIEVRTKDGQAVLTNATPEMIEESVAELLDS